MASGVCNAHDPNHGTDNDTAGLKEEGAHDRSRILEGDSTDWSVFQLEFDMRQQDISISERFFHPDAQGKQALRAHVVMRLHIVELC